ncbi:MAG TPA: tetratricopeptide repeat protein [Vicinamibacteria bacterium]|nr:tetratricopeptide repeat protein [Vicinamibacteria bacterium]
MFAATLLLAIAAGTEPRLDHLDPLVREQIQERQAWHRTVTAAAAPGDEAVDLAFGELGNLYHAYGLHEAAEAAYVEARRRDPRDFRWIYYLGLVHRARNEPDKSVARLDEALGLKPDDVPALVRLAEVHADANRPEAAAPLFDRAVRLDPANAVALAGLGQIALSRHEWARAAHLFARALAAQPAATALHYPLALAHRGAGDRALAQAEIAKWGTQGPTLDDPLSRRLHGLSAGQATHLQRGAAAAAGGDMVRAVEEFRHAVAEDPLYSAPRVNLGLALLRAGDAPAAEEALRAALALAPESPAAHVALGYLESGQGAHGKAVEHYRAALAREPGREEARFNLAQSLLDLKRHGEAASEFARLVASRPESPVLRLAEVSALVLAGRDADARHRLEEGLEALPRDGDLAHALARLLAASDDPAVRDGPRALEIAQAIVATSEAIEHAETLAMALAEVGRFEEAARTQREVVARAKARGAAGEVERSMEAVWRYEKGQPSRGPWRESGVFVRRE